MAVIWVRSSGLHPGQFLDHHRATKTNIMVHLVSGTNKAACFLDYGRQLTQRTTFKLNTEKCSVVTVA